MSYLTFRYRVRDSRSYRLNRMAYAVNQVWNYCNATSYESFKRGDKFLSKEDLRQLTRGSCKMLGHTVQAVTNEHTDRRTQFKKAKLGWRDKKSLGWIRKPTKGVLNWKVPSKGLPEPINMFVVNVPKREEKR